MNTALKIMRAGPLATVQDSGRFGMLAHGVSASGPMDRSAYAQAAEQIGGAAAAGLEITMAGIEFELEGSACAVGLAGGDFTARHNGKKLSWPGQVNLVGGDILAITPGANGNYGYLRFNAGLDLPTVLGSLSTNSRAQLGGYEGRALKAGDRLRLAPAPNVDEQVVRQTPDGPIRVVWGMHADLFPSEVRQRFVSTTFVISPHFDRMGVRLADDMQVFARSTILSLVSDAIVPGDIQILGDGTPIVLMRDHQPTGGYPRIATVISADLDRFAQLRPGTAIAFRSVSVNHAHQLLRSISP